MSDIYLDDCGCCQGIHTQTPAEITNAPGLPSISYRVGTFNQFKQSMLARLSAADLPALRGLNTRSNDDFSIAILDSWAVVCDVLTFYQERIANESYTRTAIERASLLQLARAVSYELRPGVAADTYLAFTLEDTPGSPGQAIIDIGTKVQSLPNPGEKPQVFESIEAIEAHSLWNAIKPRKTRPQELRTDMPSMLLKGAATNLRPGDLLLIVAPNAGDHKPPAKALRRINRVVVDNTAQQTTVYLEDAVLAEKTASGGSAAGQEQPLTTPPVPVSSSSQSGSSGNGTPTLSGREVIQVTDGQKQSSTQTPVLLSSSDGTLSGGQVNGRDGRNLSLSFNKLQSLNNTTVDTVVRGHVWHQRDLDALATVQRWPVQDVLANAAAQSHNGSALLTAPGEDETGVFVLRIHASLFGYSAPDWQSMPDSVRKTYFDNYKAVNPDDPSVLPDFTDWPFISTFPAIIVAGSSTPSPQPQNVLDLDRVYPQLLNKSWVVVMRPDGSVVIALVDSTTETSVVNYSLSAKITRLKLQTTAGITATSMADIRQTTVYGQSEKLALADLPADKPVQNKTIEAPGLYYGLRSGRMLMVAGELANLDGVQASEVTRLADTSFDTSFPGGLTTLTLQDNLFNTYKPETVTIYGNIVRATQGETVQEEVLGNGDASQPYQRFTLRQGPLTYLHDNTPSGITSTLKVYVNGIQWQEVPELLGHGPRDRVFITRTSDDGKTTIQFGDGQSGARLPDGQENVRVTYRKGSGSPGHVNARQLTQLMTRPLGVKSVINPQAPLGAEDPEAIDGARSNASLTVLTLGRIVSVQDFENFARSFVGLAKAQATLISTSRVRGVFVTIAGTDGKEIQGDDQLYKRVFFAMRAASDPTVPLKLQSYRKVLFRLSAHIKVEADFAVADVLVAVQQTVRMYFSFETRSFGQSVTRKEVTTVIQDVPGVVTASLDTLYRIGDTPVLNNQLNAAIPVVGPTGTVLAAELLMADTVPFDALEVIP